MEETLSDALIERFWSKVCKGAPDECWPWTGQLSRFGYGKFAYRTPGSRHFKVATHISLHIAGLPRPSGALALHSCRNPACVNPRHLRWGTISENALDAVADGTHQMGEHHWKSKFTEDSIRAIRADPRPTRTIARAYGVYPYAIASIKKRMTWKHVT